MEEVVKVASPRLLHPSPISISFLPTLLWISLPPTQSVLEREKLGFQHQTPLMWAMGQPDAIPSTASEPVRLGHQGSGTAWTRVCQGSRCAIIPLPLLKSATSTDLGTSLMEGSGHWGVLEHQSMHAICSYLYIERGKGQARMKWLALFDFYVRRCKRHGMLKLHGKR